MLRIDKVPRRVQKNKVFHDKRCQRLCRRRNAWGKEAHKTCYRPSKCKKFLLQAPKELDLFDSTGDSLKFFSEVSSTILQCGVHCSIYFDLSKIEIISPDAIMYLIAIINNTKRIWVYGINCEGNMPENVKARSLFQEVGFYRYFSSTYNHNVVENNKYMKIQNGINADATLASNFCDFVHSNNNKTCKDTKNLYTMIVELMTNTHQHAYQDYGDSQPHCTMKSNWYLYAQDFPDSIRFIFLDTGLGIPKTVAKRWKEIFGEKIGIAYDSTYLESVLTGKYTRTETKLAHRGKGLPGIYDNCKTEAIYNLKIISGKAICGVDSDSIIHTKDIPSTFQGTLFSWEIKK